MKKKITLIFLQGLGNSIINYPIYHAISSHLDTQILTFKNGSSAFYRELGAKVIEVESIPDLVTTSLGIISDISFSFYPSWRREMLALNLVRSKQKYYFQTDSYFKYFLGGEALQRNSEIHDHENNLEILRILKISPTDYLKSLDIYGDHKPTNNYVVIHPTASTPLKHYPVGFWRAIIEHLSSKFEKIYILSGSKSSEITYIEEFKHEKVELAISLPFSRLIPLIKYSNLFIGLDSSMMHLAALLNKNIIALWSFADVKRIYPYSKDVNIYAPSEIKNSIDFKYPKKELIHLERANPRELIEIMNGKKSPDIFRTDLVSNQIKLFYF